MDGGKIVDYPAEPGSFKSVFGGIVVTVMVALHNRLPNKTQNTFYYVVGGSVNFKRSCDIFLNSSVRKTLIQQDTGTSSSGGGRKF